VKVLLIDPTLVYPSERAKLAALAAQSGVSMEALTGHLHREGTRELRLPDIAEWFGVPVHVGKTIGKFPNRTWMLGQLRQCLQKRPDVILAYTDWNHWLTFEVALASAFWARQSKLIIQAWENQTPTWRTFPQRNALLYVLDGALEKIIFRAADGIAARNPQAVEVLQKRGYGKQIRLIPWGVDTELFRPQEPASGKEFTVGYVGRLVREKWIDDLLAALPGIEGVQALIVGSGPAERELQDMAKKLGINARFRAAVPQEELPTWYGRMDLLVLPSRTTRRWAEQFGRVLVEAMAMGVPVIGSDSGAIPWVIGDKDLIYPEGNVQELRNLILTMKSSEHLRRIKADEGRRRARETFTWEIHARATVEFCREVISCSR
jgi:glycosyltransferase involved in cell wall biosynthesis